MISSFPEQNRVSFSYSKDTFVASASSAELLYFLVLQTIDEGLSKDVITLVSTLSLMWSLGT
jgi:hypothetical protein